MNNMAQIQTFEDASNFLISKSDAHLRKAYERRSLHVTWIEKTGSLIFTVILPNGDIKPGGESTISNSGSTIERYLNEIGEFIKETSRIVSKGDSAKESQKLTFAGYGKALFNALIPNELREEIETWLEGTWLTISTNEQWIPWELLHDKEGFLLDRFLIFRLPRVNAMYKNLKEPSHPKKMQESEKNSSHVHKIVHVIGGDISEESVTKCDAHFVNLDQSVKLVRLERKNVDNVVREIASADLVHFTCHGHVKPLRLQVSEIDGQVFNLTIPAMEMVAVKAGCTIFANACNSALSEIIFAEFNSFGWEFYKKGAAIFIGTIGTVPIDNALEFAQQFYDTVFVNGDLCHAFRDARNTNESIGPMRFLYCFYANPLSIPQFLPRKKKE